MKVKTKGKGKNKAKQPKSKDIKIEEIPIFTPEEAAALTDEERERIANADYSDLEKEANEFYEKVVVPEKEAEKEEIIQDFDEVISTEQDFLEFFKNADEVVELGIVFRGKLLKFNIRPIVEGEDLSFIDLDKNIFADLKPDELKLFRKHLKGEDLTDTEQEKLDEINRKSLRNSAEKTYTMMTKLCALFATPPVFEDVPEELREAKKIEWWTKTPMNLRLFLGGEILDILGLNFNETIKLFHVS